MDTHDVQNIMAPILRDMENRVVEETARRFRDVEAKVSMVWECVKALEARVSKLEGH